MSFDGDDRFGEVFVNQFVCESRPCVVMPSGDCVGPSGWDGVAACCMEEGGVVLFSGCVVDTVNLGWFCFWCACYKWNHPKAGLGVAMTGQDGGVVVSYGQ